MTVQIDLKFRRPAVRWHVRAVPMVSGTSTQPDSETKRNLAGSSNAGLSVSHRCRAAGGASSTSPKDLLFQDNSTVGDTGQSRRRGGRQFYGRVSTCFRGRIWSWIRGRSGRRCWHFAAFVGRDAAKNPKLVVDDVLPVKATTKTRTTLLVYIRFSFRLWGDYDSWYIPWEKRLYIYIYSFFGVVWAFICTLRFGGK